jgi:DNA invertase Pin-like site-specific DNA recombinase
MIRTPLAPRLRSGPGGSTHCNPHRDRHSTCERGIVLRSLREGIDTSNATGRMVAGVLASLAELELELGRERRSAAREARRARGHAIGRPKALDASKAALAQRMHASGEAATTIAATLGVSRATIYRILADTDSAN